MKTKYVFLLFFSLIIQLLHGCEDTCGDLHSNPETTYKDSLSVIVPLHDDSLKFVIFSSSFYTGKNSITPVYNYNQNLGDTIKIVIAVKTNDSPSIRLPFNSKRAHDTLKVWHSYGQPPVMTIINKNPNGKGSSTVLCSPVPVYHQVSEFQIHSAQGRNYTFSSRNY